MRKKTTYREIYEFIVKHREEMGYSPSVREIGKAVGLKSSSTVYDRLKKMRFCGMIRDGGRMTSRTIVPVPEGEWEKDADAYFLHTVKQEDEDGGASPA